MNKYLILAFVLSVVVPLLRAQDVLIDTNKLSLDLKVPNESEETKPLMEDIFQQKNPWHGLIRGRYYNVNERQSGDPQFKDYFYTRVNVRYSRQDTSVEGAGVFVRQSFQPAINLENCGQYHMKKYFILLKNPKTFGDIIAGNYKLSFGQGLIFYDGLGEYARTAGASTPSAGPDTGTNTQNYLKGIVWNNKAGRFDYYIFLSDKKLDSNITDGAADIDLYAIRDNYNELITTNDLEKYGNLEEKLAGARLQFGSRSANVGVTGYSADYSPALNHSKTAGYYSHIYRGDNLGVGGIDAAFERGSLNITGEAGFSKKSAAENGKNMGSAWAITPIFKIKKSKIFVVFYDYSPYYYNRHAQGPSFDGEPPNNEKGISGGIQMAGKKNKFFAGYKAAKTRLSEWKLSSQSDSPNFPAGDKEAYLEYTFKPSKSVEVYARRVDAWEEKYVDLDESALYEYSQVVERGIKNRLQLSLSSQQSKFKLRYDHNSLKIKEQSKDTSRDLIFGEFRYEIFEGLKIASRISFFSKADIYMAEYEPGWDNVYSSTMLAFESGVRFFLTAEYDISEKLSLWIKCGRTEYDNTANIANDCKIQIDYKM